MPSHMPQTDAIPIKLYFSFASKLPTSNFEKGRREAKDKQMEDYLKVLH